MALISIVRRATDHELVVALNAKERAHLFGDKPPENPRCTFVGNGQQGVMLIPSTMHDRSTRKMKYVEPNRLDRDTVVKVWLKATMLGLTPEYRAPQLVRVRMERGRRIILPPIHQAWYGRTMDIALKNSPLDLSLLDRLPENSPSPPPPPPALSPPPPPHQSNGSAFETLFELPAGVEAFEQPMSGTSRLPAQTMDVEARRKAFTELMVHAGEVNTLLAQCGDGLVRLEIDEKGRLIVARLYRPGQARLRQP